PYRRTPTLSLLPCPSAPRALHSFPTRRSSDLISTPAARCAPRACSGFAARALTRHLRSCAVKARAEPPTLHTCRGASLQRLRRRDRKSTRLNSSHDQISYAVFCLKKKKTTTRA